MFKFNFLAKEIVTQTSYGNETTEIFATPKNQKLEWLNALNDYISLLQKKGPSIVITGDFVTAGLR